MQSCPGLEQYSIKKFAEAFETLPRALAENSGVKGNELISKLYAAHHDGNKNMGFDIEVSDCEAGGRLNNPVSDLTTSRPTDVCRRVKVPH